MILWLDFLLLLLFNKADCIAAAVVIVVGVVVVVRANTEHIILVDKVKHVSISIFKPSKKERKKRGRTNGVCVCVYLDVYLN